MLQTCANIFIYYCAENQNWIKILNKALDLEKDTNKYGKYKQIIEKLTKLTDISCIQPFLEDKNQESKSNFDYLSDLLQQYLNAKNAFKDITNYKQIPNFMKKNFEINLLIETNEQEHINYGLTFDEQIHFIFFQLEEKFYLSTIYDDHNQEEQTNRTISIQVQKTNKIEQVYISDKDAIKCIFVLFQLSDIIKYSIEKEDNGYQVIEKKHKEKMKNMINSFLFDIVKEILSKSNFSFKFQIGINSNLDLSELEKITKLIKEDAKFKKYYSKEIDFDLSLFNSQKQFQVFEINDKRYEIVYDNLLEICYENESYIITQQISTDYEICSNCQSQIVSVFYSQLQICMNCLIRISNSCI